MRRQSQNLERKSENKLDVLQMKWAGNMLTGLQWIDFRIISVKVYWAYLLWKKGKSGSAHIMGSHLNQPVALLQSQLVALLHLKTSQREVSMMMNIAVFCR